MSDGNALSGDKSTKFSGKLSNPDINLLNPVPTASDELIKKRRQTTFITVPALSIRCIGKSEPLVDDETGLNYYMIIDDKDNSRLEFTAKVDGSRQNYITVRFKGGSKLRSRLFLRDADGSELNYPNDVWFGGLLDEPSGGNDGKKSGFFFYTTVSIPRHITDEKNEVVLSIWDDNPPSRNIYQIYSHTDSFFTPIEKTHVTVTPYKWPKFKPFSPELVEAIDNKLVEIIEKQGFRNMKEQLWAADWREKVARREWPADMIGGSCIRFNEQKWTSLSEEEMDEELRNIKNQTMNFYVHRNNMGPLTNPYAGAMAYATEGTRQYKDNVWLERIALALDFTRRAQGATGAFYSPWTKAWVGGPDRAGADGKLEGNAHWAFGMAFVLTAEDMEERGLLDELVDDDCDPSTPPVKRREAYIDLFSNSTKFLSNCVGHAPNQEMFQLFGIYPGIKALELLKADKNHFPDMDKVKERIKRIAGDVPLGEFTWVTPKGITLESWGIGHGGYTCEYGSPQVDEYWHLYKMSGEESLKRMSGVAGSGFTHFVYPVFRDDEKPEWTIDGYINWRHRMRAGGGFSPSFGCILASRNPYHIRLLQMNHSGLTSEDINNWKGAEEGNWFYQSMMGLLRQIQEKRQVFRDFPNDDVMLPMESGAPDFVWGDEIAQVVSFKDGETRVMMSMNQWYNKNIASGYAFIHFLSPEFDTYAVIPHDTTKSRNMFSLNHVYYGDYFVVMNSRLDGISETVNISDEWAQDTAKIVDLNTGMPLASRTFPIEAQKTYVYKRVYDQSSID